MMGGVQYGGGRRARTLAVAAAALVAFPWLAQAQAVFDTGPAPVFTAAQAVRGAAAYSSNCVMCHGEHLNDGQFGPPLQGDMFKSHWHYQSPGALLAFMAVTMPPAAPGSLPRQTLADIEAYVLQANGYEAGAAELSATALLGNGAGNGLAAARAPAAPAVNRGPENRDATFLAVTAKRRAQLDALTPVTAEVLRHPPAGDWLMWRRGYDSLGYSPLTQITPGNVGTLRTAWSWALPLSPDEITPLVHDGVLFIKSANEIQALDGASGDLLWKYIRFLPDSLQNGRTEIVKNLAIYQNKLFAPTGDGHIVALDVRSGKVLWDQPVLDAEATTQHLRMDGGPIVVNGKVVQGVSGCNNYKGGCFIVALDAETGHKVWRFNTLARPGQPGGDSWNGAPVDQRFGGSVWTSGSYDPDLNLLYFGTGQTYDTATLLQAHPQSGQSADGLYTDSTVALDPNTGKLVWYYQHFNRDVWDFDWVFEQTLLTLPVHGTPTRLLVTGGKIAIFDAVDRRNGRYAFSRDLGLQNLVTSIDPKSGQKIIDPALAPEADKTKFVCPHPGGARSWPSTAYDPTTHILYVPLVESCMDFTWKPRDAAATAEGGSDIHWILHPRPHSDGNIGRIEAINLETGKVAWMRRQRAPETSSVLSTAGGVVFDGTRDRRFKASDARTGKILWETRLNAVPSSTPISYSVDGRQYIAVVTGGGGADEATWPVLTPEMDNPAGGTSLWVFELPFAAARQ